MLNNVSSSSHRLLGGGYVDRMKLLLSPRFCFVAFHYVVFTFLHIINTASSNHSFIGCGLLFRSRCRSPTRWPWALYRATGATWVDEYCPYNSRKFSAYVVFIRSILNEQYEFNAAHMTNSITSCLNQVAANFRWFLHYHMESLRTANILWFLEDYSKFIHYLMMSYSTF